MGAVVADIEPGGGGYEGVGEFVKTVTQAVLLFGEETWVLTTRMERALSSFQHRVVRRLTRRQLRRRGVWDLGINLIVGGNGGIRILGGGDIRYEEAEYGHTVYFKATDSGTL